MIRARPLGPGQEEAAALARTPRPRISELRATQRARARVSTAANPTPNPKPKRSISAAARPQSAKIRVQEHRGDRACAIRGPKPHAFSVHLRRPANHPAPRFDLVASSSVVADANGCVQEGASRRVTDTAVHAFWPWMPRSIEGCESIVPWPGRSVDAWVQAALV